MSSTDVMSLQVQPWWTGWCSCSWLWPAWRPWRWPRPCWRRVACGPSAWRAWRLSAPPASVSSSWTTPPHCTALWVPGSLGVLTSSALLTTLHTDFYCEPIDWAGRAVINPQHVGVHWLFTGWKLEEERQREVRDVAVCSGDEWEGDKERISA